MAPQYQPDFHAVIAPMLPAMKAIPKPALHDVHTRRERTNGGFADMIRALPYPTDIEQKVHHVTAKDGHELKITQFRPGNQPSTSSGQGGPAIYYIHGGGYTALSVEIFASHIAALASKSSVSFFAVGYRLAPEHPFPIPLEDCYAGLLWLQSHAADLNIDPARIAVMGESAGGGLAAAVAIVARDQNLSPPLKKQILVYPMIDDRNIVPDPLIESYATFSHDDNITGWAAYLTPALKPGDPNSDEIPPTAAPARLKDFKGLPSTYIDTCELDIFREEDIEYARSLLKAGVETEFHLFQGVPHGFEIFAPDTDVVRRATEGRLAAIRLV